MRWLAFGLLFSLAPIAQAGDWPQIQGPQRSGAAVGETLGSWPKSGPKVAWSARVGSGYGGPAIAAGRVVLFHRVDDVERVEAFDLTTGKSLWKTDFPASYRGGIDPDLGPRTVPTIDNGLVYAFGAGGDLHCVALATGKKVWSRELAVDYSAPDGYFGAGSSPIIAGGQLWLNVGGKDAGLVALDPQTGKTTFKGTTEQASYSSPTLATIHGQESLIFVTRYNCLGIQPRTGEEQFSFPFGKRGPTVNAATPLVFNDLLFVSASYGVGARLVKFEKLQPTTVWENDTSMSSQYTTCVHHQGHLYGVAGREDVGDATLRCIEVKSGEVKWDEDGFGIAHIILVKDQLLIVRHDGEVLHAPATPSGFKALARGPALRGTIRALPALSSGKLLIRSVAASGQAELVAVEVQ